MINKIRKPVCAHRCIPDGMSLTFDLVRGFLGMKTIQPFRCDFHYPKGNRIQIADLQDEATV